MIYYFTDFIISLNIGFERKELMADGFNEEGFAKIFMLIIDNLYFFFESYMRNPLSLEDHNLRSRNCSGQREHRSKLLVL